MLHQETRKLRPEISAEDTLRLDPEWLHAQIAGDATPGEAVSDTATTAEKSFETPTVPTRCADLIPRWPETASGVLDRHVRDLHESIEQFAEFGRDRRGPRDIEVEHTDFEATDMKGQAVREYFAIHQRCSEGLSVADIAASNARYIASSARHFVDRIALSYWDLYEVVGTRDDVFTLSSRFDSKLRVVQRFSDSIEVGDIVVARVVDLGEFSVASSWFLPTHTQQACLYDELSETFVGRSWAGFMRNRGARIILRWALSLGQATSLRF